VSECEVISDDSSDSSSISNIDEGEEDDEEETNRGQASVTLDPSHNDDENITLEETMGHVSFDGTCFCGVLQRWQQ
jgi:hypothetical protein